MQKFQSHLVRKSQVFCLQYVKLCVKIIKTRFDFYRRPNVWKQDTQTCCDLDLDIWTRDGCSEDVHAPTNELCRSRLSEVTALETDRSQTRLKYYHTTMTTFTRGRNWATALVGRDYAILKNINTWTCDLSLWAQQIRLPWYWKQ